MSRYKDNKKKYTPDNSVVARGTISVSGYMSTIVSELDGYLEVFDSLLEQYPLHHQYIYSTIEKIKEAKIVLSDENTSLLSSRGLDLDNYEKVIKEYEKLINKDNVTEPELQDFFEKNPLLINQNLKELIPKPKFGGELEPDFLAILHNENYILIEIETPRDELYTQKGNPRKKFTHAEQQIRDYLKWASNNRQFLRDRGFPIISDENTTGLVIIGMRKNLNPEEQGKLKRHNSTVRSSHKIKTFDDILIENQQLLLNLRKGSKK